MSWVKVFGTRYAKGCVIITGLNYGQPSFGRIDKVLVVAEIVVFQYHSLQLIKFSEHLNAYEELPLYDTHFIKQKDLQDYHSLGIHNGFGQNANKLFVVLHYKVDILQ